jgi:hypothetical protein
MTEPSKGAISASRSSASAMRAAARYPALEEHVRDDHLGLGAHDLVGQRLMDAPVFVPATHGEERLGHRSERE